MTELTPADTARLVATLRNPHCYAHPVDQVELIETHISYVLLTGTFAYKLKKPLDLGFLDFSTLAARRACCDEELRLNRRTAPNLYLETVAVTGSLDTPRMGGDGPPVDYAVKMRQFDPHALLDARAREGALTDACVDALAQAVSAFHQSVAIAPPDSPYGSPDSVLEPARANFTQILALDPDVATRARLDALWVWTEREHTRLAPLMVARKVSGQVRECHGDLHLGNVALIDERPVLFDCIEFNPSLRWIDVMSEVAFTVMDLMDHGRPALAHRFLNTYLEVTGDYTGAPLLGYYAVYRALVRAKVAFIRAHQPGTSSTERTQALTAFERHVDLAEGLGRATAPRLIITHGLSGSGKTTVAQFLLEQLGAVRIRSDVERKRLFGLAANAKTVRGVSRGIYAANANRRTYDRLAELASAMLAAGVSVIVDATFLRRAERDRFRALARTHGAPFALVVCDAPAKVLRGRVAQRAQAGRDASEADASVLEAQLQSAELLGNDERIEAHMIATDRPLEEIRRACDALAITLLSESVTGT